MQRYRADKSTREERFTWLKFFIYIFLIQDLNLEPSVLTETADSTSIPAFEEHYASTGTSKMEDRTALSVLELIESKGR